MSYAEYGRNYATLDHVVAKSRGGGEALTNKTLACLRCNQMKAGSTNWPPPSFTFADLFPRAKMEFEHEDYDYADPSE